LVKQEKYAISRSSVYKRLLNAVMAGTEEPLLGLSFCMALRSLRPVSSALFHQPLIMLKRWSQPGSTPKVVAWSEIRSVRRVVKQLPDILQESSRALPSVSCFPHARITLDNIQLRELFKTTAVRALSPTEQVVIRQSVPFPLVDKPTNARQWSQKWIFKFRYAAMPNQMKNKHRVSNGIRRCSSRAGTIQLPPSVGWLQRQCGILDITQL
jgi:hypothetical protein